MEDRISAPIFNVPFTHWTLEFLAALFLFFLIAKLQKTFAEFKLVLILGFV